MLRSVVCLLLLCVSLCSEAQSDRVPKRMAFSGYGGGMMLHTGFVQSREFNLYAPNGTLRQSMRLRGMPFGIGGAIRVRFGRHLRVGGEGYVSTLRQRKTKGYNTIGWGGLLADCSWTKNKWTFFIGGTIGGGSVKNLLFTEASNNDFLLEDGIVAYRKYSLLCIAPFLGFEYTLHDSIRLVVKTDYLCGLTPTPVDFTTGPRLYIGINFCHWK